MPGHLRLVPVFDFVEGGSRPRFSCKGARVLNFLLGAELGLPLAL